MASQETRPEKTTQVNADSLAFYREKLNDSLQEIQSKVQQWREYEADYEQLREGLERLPDETSHQIMVPVGPLAFFPGKLVKTNELMVLLGENWFVERSAAQAVEIIDRRIEMVQQQLNEATRQSTDLQTRLQLSNGLGDLTGYPLNEEGQPVVEIREEYHSDEEKQVPATISASKKTPSPKSSDNTVDEQEENERFFAYLRQLEEELKEEEEEEIKREEEEVDASDQGQSLDSSPPKDLAPFQVNDKPRPLIEEIPDDHDTSETGINADEAKPISIAASTLKNKKQVHFAPGTVSPEHRPPTPLRAPIVLPTSDNYEQFTQDIMMPSTEFKVTDKPSTATTKTTTDVVPNKKTSTSAVVAQQVQERPMTSVNPEEEEEKLHFREIQSEYHRRRNQMIAVSKSPLTDGVTESPATLFNNEKTLPVEQSKQEQEGTSNSTETTEDAPPKRVSRFKAARLGLS